MAEMIPVDAGSPPCPMDDTTAPLSSLKTSHVFVETLHSNRILEGLNSLRLKEEFCDVILCCGGQEFPCHRNVLVSFSSYFEAMFATLWKESQQSRVAINGAEPESIGLLVNYAYTSEVLISTANVQALLAAANLLNVRPVQEACCLYMERHMDEKNCVGVHCFAEAHSCKKLARQSMDYILEHFRVVCQQEEFLSLSVDKLKEILANDDINVPKEEMVFEAAMLWLNRDPTRRQSFQKVLEHIRLPVISPSYLQDVIETQAVVKESQGCQGLISEAKNQDLLPCSDRAQPRTPTVIVRVAGHGSEEILRSFESFDPLTNQWRNLAYLPFDVHSHCLVVSGPTLYLAGGILPDGSVSKEMWRYDPSHDSWSKMASMNCARCNFGLVMVDGFLFAMGGYDERRKTCAASLERYDPNADLWQLLEQKVEAVETPGNFYTVTLNGRIYVLDGFVAFKYNPKTSVWSEVPAMTYKRTGAAVCTLKGRIYFIGGYYNVKRTSTDEVQYYDPKTNQWTLVAPMKERRGDAGVAVVEGKIYVLGGLNNTDSAQPQTIERYCEDTDTWEIVGRVPTPHSWYKCVSVRLRKDAHAVNASSATADSVPMN